MQQYQSSSKQSINLNPYYVQRLTAVFGDCSRRRLESLVYSAEPKVRGVFQGLASALLEGVQLGLPICNGPESRAGLICFKPPPSSGENNRKGLARKRDDDEDDDDEDDDD